jgi:hypothetical protein
LARLRGARKPFDDEFCADMRSLFATFHHVTPTTQQLGARIEER